MPSYRIRLPALFLTLVVSFNLAFAAQPATTNWLDATSITNFANELELDANIPASWTLVQLNQAVPQNKIKDLLMPHLAPGQRNWFNYQKAALNPKKIALGLDFYQQHKAQFIEAEKRFGVEPWVILGILGMETNFGTYTGNFKTLDVLTTLTFDFPPLHPKATEKRSFYRSELSTLLRLAYSQKINLTQTKGSFAGAIGWAQFMPTSLEQYAVDGNNDGVINLFEAADAIFSIANYLQQFGWQHQLPAIYSVGIEKVTNENLAILLQDDILPKFNFLTLQKLGIKFYSVDNWLTKTNLALIKLENAEMLPTYLVGSTNFYVITRYNKSSYYALAVVELGQKIIHLSTPTAH